MLALLSRFVFERFRVKTWSFAWGGARLCDFPLRGAPRLDYTSVALKALWFKLELQGSFWSPGGGIGAPGVDLKLQGLI